MCVRARECVCVCEVKSFLCIVFRNESGILLFIFNSVNFRNGPRPFRARFGGRG